MTIPNDLLKDKKIILGVTGSIAVYKSLELLRLFVKAGAEVSVVMSEAAKKFVTPLTFETLSANAVLDDTNESWSSDHNHIKITQDADLFLIAPCSANTLAKLSYGVADNILLQTALAFSGKKLLAPSANTNMIHNPITQENISRLKSAAFYFVATQTKELACKTTGDGAMAEPLEIFWQAARLILGEDFWSGRAVIVSGGGTIEQIDDVRYLSNFSSGMMASALATALYLKGADVTLVATRHERELPLGVKLIALQSSSEMFEALQESRELALASKCKTPYLFMAAAVSDFIPKESHSGKLKKDSFGDSLSLELQKNRDILASLAKDGFINIGFKAEMDAQNAVSNAKNMLKNKALDGVCLNILKDSKSFGTSSNAIEFITQNDQISFPDEHKLTLSLKLTNAAKNMKEQI